MTYVSTEQNSPSLVELDREECLKLLATAAIGRVVLSVHCIPTAVPVSLSLINGDVVFVTNVGSALDAGVAEHVVRVEVDELDRADGSSWTVVLTGVAQVVTDLATIKGTTLLRDHWAPGSHPFLIRVPPNVISGRRIFWGRPGDSSIGS
jgi:nitroimidazol reductase NimA-like FMN-containing flavoprotein (pyridoxamine 5'-phosphate oxidase superfamily)